MEGTSDPHNGAPSHTGRLIWKALSSFPFSLPSARGVGCQSSIFFPHPRILLDMTDSLQGLLTTRPSTSHLVIMKNTLSLVTRTALSTASKPRLYSCSFASGFKQNRRACTFLKKCSIFFAFFKLLATGTFLSPMGKATRAEENIQIPSKIRPRWDRVAG